MKTIEVIVYKQGNNWMINNGGYVGALPYYLKTKKDVREYIVNGNDDPGRLYKITFA